MKRKQPTEVPGNREKRRQEALAATVDLLDTLRAWWLQGAPDEQLALAVTEQIEAVILAFAAYPKYRQSGNYVRAVEMLHEARKERRSADGRLESTVPDKSAPETQV
jgi:hypothetical protein